MSIINDALKKAEKQRDSKQSDAHRILHDIGGLQRSSLKSPSERWFIWGGLTIICALTAFLLFAPDSQQPARVVSEPLAKEEPRKEIAAKPEPKIAQSTFNLRKISLEILPKAEDFTLNGIVYDKKRPLAIVNNKIVTEGSLVDGARLLEIQPDNVKLSYKDQEFRVRLK
ncbi:MAG: general secretion pathway protein GspB [Candidatus Omnitrophica bacterium]|nr:general secretion pathway protein GspB [Candidatus Omnitrophota bacterium]